MEDHWVANFYAPKTKNEWRIHFRETTIGNNNEDTLDIYCLSKANFNGIIDNINSKSETYTQKIWNALYWSNNTEEVLIIMRDY